MTASLAFLVAIILIIIMIVIISKKMGILCWKNRIIVVSTKPSGVLGVSEKSRTKKNRVLGVNEQRRQRNHRVNKGFYILAYQHN